MFAGRHESAFLAVPQLLPADLAGPADEIPDHQNPEIPIMAAAEFAGSVNDSFSLIPHYSAMLNMSICALFSAFFTFATACR